MYISIDHHSGVPVSPQISEAIKYRVVSGSLPPGERLPSVRALASQLHLNPTTVARVYRQLESEGVIYTQAGNGTFVAGRPPGLTVSEQRRRLEGPIRQLVVEAGRLGVDFDRLQDWVDAEVQRIEEGKELKP
ncbi:GntR family transcriptional regulator [bacterium]|nr:GntR family transcriptional regulator [bacterium]